MKFETLKCTLKPRAEEYSGRQSTDSILNQTEKMIGFLSCFGKPSTEFESYSKAENLVLNVLF